MTYKDTLDQLWAAHLTPRTLNAPTVVSTFAGCGGSSLGYSAAGYRELLAIEWDDHAVAVFQRNFPTVPLYQGDIASFDPASLNLACGELDVLDGSPPCQGFSMVGRRRITDSRNQLFREYVRLLDVWNPRAFVMENVSGLLKGKMRLIFAQILAKLRTAGSGYNVTARLCDASYLGVPQSRKRLIIVGVRQDLGLPAVHPRPLSHQVTVAQAITDLHDPGIVEYPVGMTRELVPLIPQGGCGQDVLTRFGRKGSYWGVLRVTSGRPSNTLIRKFDPFIAGFLHPTLDRYLGSRELARIQSFPDQFDWGEAGYRTIHELIGNSVPPLMLRAVAETIRTDILEGSRDVHPAT